MFNTFVINLGYVESTRLSQFIFTHDEGFETVTAGMKSIRSVLVEIAKDEQARKMKRKSASACCVKNATAKFCPECGTSLAAVIEDDSEYYYRCAEIFDDMLSMSIDSISDQGMWDVFEDAGWNLCGTDPGELDPSRVFVWSVYRWVEDEDEYLEWFVQGKTYSNRQDE